MYKLKDQFRICKLAKASKEAKKKTEIVKPFPRSVGCPYQSDFVSIFPILFDNWCDGVRARQILFIILKFCSGLFENIVIRGDVKTFKRKFNSF